MDAKQAEAFFFEGKMLFVLDGVYAPAEDSFLLAASLKGLQGKKTLDLGCGTGMQAIAALKLGAKSCVLSDKNSLALKTAKKNLAEFGFANFSLVESDLFENIKEKFDVIIFNPPYVPSDRMRYLDVDGGKKGREVLDVFLAQAKNFLLPKGELFFLQSSHNGVLATKKILRKEGFSFEIVGTKKLFFEELFVFRARI